MGQHLDDPTLNAVSDDQADKEAVLPEDLMSEDDVKEIRELFSSFAAARPKPGPEVSAEYLSLIDELLNIRAAYEDHYDELEAKANAATASVAFAVKGDMHRGIRCPSQVMDLFVGGCHRGQPLARLQSNTSSYLRYSLDDQDRLLKLETYFKGNCTHKEYLIRVGRKVYGIQREMDMPDHQTSFLSLEEYDDSDRLIRYASVLPDRFFGKGRHEIYYSERIRYDNDGRISQATLANGIPITNCLQVDAYQVITSADGQITGFEQNGRHWDARKRNSKGKIKQRKPADLVKRFNQLLDLHLFPQTLELGNAIDAFEEMAHIPLETESDDLLFEAGHYDFTGEEMFWLSLTRQFDTPDPDDSEYLQLQLRILFKPEDVPMKYSITEWSNGDQAAFFSMIRHSELIEYIHRNGLKSVRYVVCLNET